MAKIIDAIGNAAMSGLTGGISGIASTAIGAVGKLFGIGRNDSEERERRAYERQKEMMGLQAQYNEQMAEANQRRNKDMWDYTNYENQVKHLREAGLNPALLYGLGGGGGASTSGGRGTGVSAQEGTASVMLGLQAKQMQAQTELMRAEAAQAQAQADKTRGADTDLTKKQQEELNARIGQIGANINNLNELTDNLKKEGKLKDFENWKNNLQQLIGEELTKESFRSELNEKIAKAQAGESQAKIDKEVADFMKNYTGKIVESELKKLDIPEAQLNNLKAQASEAIATALALTYENNSTKAISDAIEGLGGDGAWGSVLRGVVTKLIPNIGINFIGKGGK